MSNTPPTAEVRDLDQEHRDLVKALAKPGEDILNDLTGEKCYLLHAAIGLAGEAGELILWAVEDEPDMENFIEEMGDMEFFLGMARRGMMNWSRAQIVEEASGRVYLVAKDRVGAAALLSAHCCIFLDHAKKHTIYNADRNDAALFDAMCEIEAAMAALRMIHGISRQETLLHNINKLNKRYQKGSFSNEQAQARADKEDTK